jgi:hypothetical protein
MTRTCNICTQTLTLDNFYKHKGSPFGVALPCKKCSKGGLHAPSNIVASCLECNLTKKASNPISFGLKQTIPIVNLAIDKV